MITAVSDKAYLRFLNGAQNGRVYVLKELSVFELGRGSGCQVTIDDPSVAFNHGRIYRKGGVWTFFDLNTEQGSSINDIPVEKRDLAGGEILRLGSTEMQFTLTPPQLKKKTPAAPVPEMAPIPEVAAQPAPLPSGHDQPSSVSRPEILHMAPEPIAHEPVVHEPVAAAPAMSPPPVAPPAMSPPAPAMAPAAPVTPEPVPAGARYGLVVIDGDSRDVGRRVDLAGKSGVLIGRALDCDFMLSDGKVSRHHTRVEAHPDGHLLLDLNSANGTVVNGQKVSRAILKSGDYIRLGFTVIAYEVVPEPARAM